MFNVHEKTDFGYQTNLKCSISMTKVILSMYQPHMFNVHNKTDSWSTNLSFSKEFSPILVVDWAWLVHCARLPHIVKPGLTLCQKISIILFKLGLFTDFGKPCELFNSVKLLFRETVSSVFSDLRNHPLRILLHRLKPEETQVWVVLPLPAWGTQILN